MKVSMSSINQPKQIILVVEDVAETRDGIERLLKSDGYHIEVARDEADAIDSARRLPPDLILVSLAGPAIEVITIAGRIRDLSGTSQEIPVVVFCILEAHEGGEVAIGHNVHITHPDNFNQLRGLLSRLLNEVAHV